MTQIITNTEKETFELGIKTAQSLKGGEVIGLVGNLGAGKTIFTKGIAKGLGIKGVVNSPTFVIMKVYKVKSQLSKVNCLIHIDAYRLKSANDLIAIGAEEYFGKPDSIVIIEWADKIKKTLPKNTIFYNFKISSFFRSIKKDVL
jgi:tRNA threonylcarbamoyladenosine biosynthesis protein TsaE